MQTSSSIMNAPTPRAAFNPWPAALWVTFALFFAGLAVVVTIAVRNPMDLVRADYYDQEILHQRRIDAVKRTQSLGNQVSIRHDAPRQMVTLTLPDAHAAKQPVGNIHLYRPDDARLDRHLPLKLDGSGRQLVELSSLRPGRWRVLATWTLDGLEYAAEQSLSVSARGNP